MKTLLSGASLNNAKNMIALSKELATGLRDITQTAASAGQQISAIGSNHKELTAIIGDGHKKQQESLEQIAKNTAKTTNTMAQEVTKASGTMAKDLAALGQVSGLFGDESEILSAVQNYSTATLAMSSLGEEFKKLQKASEHSQSLAVAGDSAAAVGQKAGTAGKGVEGLAASFGKAAKALGGPWSIAIGLLVTALGFGVNKFLEWRDANTIATEASEEFLEAISASGGSYDDNVISTLAADLRDNNLSGLLQDSGVSMDMFADAMTGGRAAAQELNKEQEETEQRLQEIQEQLFNSSDMSDEHRLALLSERDALELKRDALGNMTEMVDEHTDAAAENSREAKEQEDAVNALTDAAIENGTATDELIDQQNELADEYKNSKRAADDLKRSLDSLTGGAVDATRAEFAFLDSVEQATDGVSKNGATLDTNTSQGRDNMQNLLRIRDASNDLTSSVWGTTESVEETIATHEQGRKEFIKVAKEMGATAEEAEDLADEYMGIPADVNTEIRANGTGTWSLEGDRGSLLGQPLATGGAVIGPGTGTSDDIPAMLSNGEHVLTAKEVQQAGGQAGVYRLRSAIRQGYVGFARGGAVGDHDPQRFARGGAVRSQAAHAISEHTEDTRIGIQNLHQSVIAGIGNYFGSLFKRIFNSGGPVVAAARTQLGVPYSWGGGGINGPSLGFGRGANTRGFDCSSLMQYAWYQGAGVRIPRVTYDQINTGRAISRGSEAPGDLVFPHRGHVAMVTKPGQVIHAPYTGASVSHRAMYPSPLAIRRPSRLFDSGGIWGSGTVGVNESGHPERVLSPRQTRAFEHLVDGVLSGHRVPVSSGAHATADRPLVGTVNVNHVPGYSTPRDVVRALDHARRTARLARPR